MEEVTVYCDGSGSGYVCAIFDYGEGYQRTYFDRITDQIFHEYRAILFAVECINLGGPDLSKFAHANKYIIYNDNQGAIQHVNGESKPPTDIIKHFVAEIQKKVKHLNVEFEWVQRSENLAGLILDGKARELFSDRGSSNNITKSKNYWYEGRPYANWPPEDDEDEY